MSVQELLAFLKQSKFATHADAIIQYARPAALLIRDQADIQSVNSRLNNAPDLPPDFEWPEHKLGPYRFLAQIDLAELPPGMPSMPAKGLVSVFYQYDENGECFWGDAGYVIARYFSPNQKLVRTKQPKDVDLGDPIPITFRSAIDLPNFSGFIDKPKLIDWPLNSDQGSEFKQLRSEWHERDDDFNDYLFGYPTNHTLAYDPTPDANWQSLFTLGSDEDLAWYFHDGDRLVTFVETKKLAIGDLSTIHSDAG